MNNDCRDLKLYLTIMSQIEILKNDSVLSLLVFIKNGKLKFDFGKKGPYYRESSLLISKHSKVYVVLDPEALYNKRETPNTFSSENLQEVADFIQKWYEDSVYEDD